MNVRKFFANTSRQALQLVRQGLGPDALILSNRAVEGGVEILAMAQGDLPPETATAQAAARERQPQDKNTAADSRRSMQAAAPAPAAAAAEDPVSRSLASEIKSMRGLIEEQLVYQAWDTAQRRDPGKARVLRDMLHAGFSAALARQLLAKMPPGLEAEQKLGWVISVLDRNLRTVAAADEIVERGGVYALVGPTGVGKTTTVAKIAARCVVRYGADRLALLTTDGYRIGAHEQLRIYGKLLGVRVIAIKDASDLQFVLDDLRGKHLVLIDTVGMSQRDEMITEQLALLSAPGTQVQRLLLLNATGNGETLDDVVRVYHHQDRRGGGHRHRARHRHPPSAVAALCHRRSTRSGGPASAGQGVSARARAAPGQRAFGASSGRGRMPADAGYRVRGRCRCGSEPWLECDLTRPKACAGCSTAADCASCPSTPAAALPLRPSSILRERWPNSAATY
jgi:flagellar biosynthesis protein FlhF